MILLLGCSGQTLRIAGTVTLAPGFEAPDSARHRLVIAAFLKREIDAGVPLDRLAPISNLYATFTASNGTFAQPVDFEIVTTGDAEDSIVFAWWKTASVAGEDRYVPPSLHDRQSAPFAIFAGRSGGAATARHVDLRLDSVRVGPLHVDTSELPD